VSAPCFATVVLVPRLELAARRVGRLRRRGQSEPELDRLADDVEWLLLMAEPTAGELVGDEETVEDALALVDRRSVEVRRLLGDRSPR
jgi:ketosteroid isomerase-like protein